MPVTATPERFGEPSLWSASVDALAAGVDITRSDDGIALLGQPDPDAARLLRRVGRQRRRRCTSKDYATPATSRRSRTRPRPGTPSTVGAYTELVDTPEHPDFAGWIACRPSRGHLAAQPDVVLFGDRQWPIKPDICMEGGNLLVDGTGLYEPHPLVSLRTTDGRDDLALSSDIRDERGDCAGRAPRARSFRRSTRRTGLRPSAA